MSSWASLKHPAQDRTGWQSPEHILRQALGPSGRWDVAPPGACGLLLGATHPVLLFSCGLQVHPRGLVGLHGHLGVGTQVRIVRCQVLLSFSQSVADLPVDECEGPKPASQRPCYAGPCHGRLPNLTWKDRWPLGWPAGL